MFWKIYYSWGALEKKGYFVVPEAALYLIKKEEKACGNIFPWTNTRLFMERVFKKQIEQEKNIPKNKNLVILDRGLWDSKAYYHFYNVEMPKELGGALENFHYDLVLFLEMLPKKYWSKTKSDRPRGQTYEVGQKAHNKIYKIYKESGLEIIIIPFLPISKRVSLVEKYLKEISRHKKF